MGLGKFHPVNVKRSLRAMQARWEKDAETLTTLGFRFGDNPDGNEGPLGETLRNLETAIAEITGGIAMVDSELNRHLTAGRAATATETADALFGSDEPRLSYVKEIGQPNPPVVVNTKPLPGYIPCGGCGADRPSQRCLGCLHDFGMASSDWVHKVYKR